MRRALFAITATLLIAGWAQEASGQCSITVLDLNGTPTLCSDSGDDWRWTGPDGFAASTMCVDAVAPGTYTLRVFDAASGTWSEPCSHTVGDPPAPPVCGISGPDSVCVGGSVTWCGPSGDFLYAWNGPGGFTSSASCVTLSAAGSYSLLITDRATNATSEPCSQTLRIVDCAPLEQVRTCPAPAPWWAAACDESGLALDSQRMADLASSVDARSAVWNFGGTREGLGALLTPVRHGRAFIAARRQFATVIANVVANDMEVTDRNGQRIGLSLDMLVDHVRGIRAGTTLGDWVATTEAALLGMNESASREKAGRETSTRIRFEAHTINSGAHSNGCSGLYQGLLADDDGDEFGMPGTPGGSTILSNGGPGPFTGASRLRWTLDRASHVELDVLDLSGRRVKHLASGTFSAGTHDLDWDGRSDNGQAVRPGAYFLSGRIGEARLAQRLILLR